MKVLTVKVLFALVLGCVLSGCGDDTPDTNVANVGGTWLAEMTIQSCTPASVCNGLQFPAGTASTTLVLDQRNDRVQGTFTYNNTPISSSVTGVVTQTQLSLTGTAVTNAGQATIRFSGVV